MRAAHAPALAMPMLCACLVACAHATTLAPLAEAPAAAATSAAQSPRFASPYAYEWFMRAELLRARGALGPAIAAYRAALTSADDDPYVLARLAGALDEQGDRRSANAQLRAALDADPRSEAAWLAAAEIAERHGEIDAALACYERAESAARTSVRPVLGLARLLRAHGSPERAIAVLTRFEARTLPGSAGAARAALALALTRDDAIGAYAAAQAWQRVATGARDALLATARELYDAGRAELALRLLQAIPAQPDDAALRLRVLLACGRNDAAEALLASLDPAAIGGMSAVAEAYLAVDRPELALELAQAALLRAPGEARTLLLQARATLELSQYAEAASLFAALPQPSSAAREGLARALRSQALPELAAEVEAALANNLQ